jgi:hypothetical protein
VDQTDQALRALEQAQAAFAVADEGRREAMRAASQAGATLRQIQAAIDRSLSYEGIRTIVGPRQGVEFEWKGELYPISEPQTRALIHKAEAYGGEGGSDIEKYGLGTDWLPAALELARAMRRVHVGTDADPIITLDEVRARALRPLLQLTSTQGLTPISDLRERLFADLGRPTPPWR